MHHMKNVCNGPNIGENFAGRGPGRWRRRRQIRGRSAGNAATGRADRHRQHRRRFRALGPDHLPGYRHRSLRAGRRQQPADGLGPRR